MDNVLAHNIESVERTEDVKIEESITFSTMLLPDNILQGLQSAGFKKPSPIQLAAIPLARCGLDLIVQAKSGTGKTLVFTVTALESLNFNIKRVQVIILAPTREIAIQIAEVIRTVGSNLKGLKVSVLVGGRSLGYDKADLQGCHIAVGCPGRVRHLIEENVLDSDAVRLLVLDEADRLFSDEADYQKDITYVYNKCGESKQVMALSATYPENLISFTQRYMRSGQHVTPSGGPAPVLLGLRQMLLVTKDHPDYNARMATKEKELLQILETVPFDQCCIFHHYSTRAESMNHVLRKRGFASMCLTGKLTLDERKDVLSSLKSNRCRILVTTDIAARGIDAVSVNLVINMGLPWDPASYLHRMGRAGRYGSQGLCISLISDGLELKKFQKLLGRIGGSSMVVNIIPMSQNCDLWNDDLSNYRKLYGIISEEQDDENDSSELSIEEYECIPSPSETTCNNKSSQEILEKTSSKNGMKTITSKPFSLKDIEAELSAFIEKESSLNSVKEIEPHKKTPRKGVSPKQKKATYSEILCRPKQSKKSLVQSEDMVYIYDNGKNKPQVGYVFQGESCIDIGEPVTAVITKKGVIKKGNAEIKINNSITAKNDSLPSKENLPNGDILQSTKDLPTNKYEATRLSPEGSSLRAPLIQTDVNVSVTNESKRNKRKRDAACNDSSSSEFLSNSEYLYQDEQRSEDDSPSGIDLNDNEDNFEHASVISSDEDIFNTTRISCPNCHRCISQECSPGKTPDWYTVMAKQIHRYVTYSRQFHSET